MPYTSLGLKMSMEDILGCTISKELSTSDWASDKPKEEQIRFPSKQQALIPTFISDNVFSTLDAVIPDPFLRILIRFALASPLEHHIPSTDNIIPHLDFGREDYIIRPVICRYVLSALNKVADFIHCAANDHNPAWREPHLEELGTRMPGISLLRCYSDANLDEIGFTALNYLRLAKMEFGYHTHWNWGAVLGMSCTEFTHRITQNFFYGGHNALRRLMSHEVLRNVVHIPLLSNSGIP
ncbi:hypothetical protein C8R44DRAFT_876205 [Mycena epipterygia]|nr:hypothetical protein C8R44DRAFT_876205 [Mycena epipterygia]